MPYDRCSYCDKELKGNPRIDWIYFARFSPFKMRLDNPNPDPRDFAPIKEKVCRECFTDMGIKVT